MSHARRLDSEPLPRRSYHDSCERVRTTGRVEQRTQATNHTRPLRVLRWFVGDRARADRSLTERRNPVRPSLTGGIERNHLEHGPVLVDGHEPLASFLGDLDFESGDPSIGAVLEVGKDALDKRMTGGEEIDCLVLDCLLAVE